MFCSFRLFAAALAVVCPWVLAICPTARGGTPAETFGARADAPIAIDQRLIDDALDRLQERQKRRTSNPSTQPVNPAAVTPTSQAWSTSISDPYGIPAVTARKLQMLRTYDARIGDARAALRRHALSPREVRQLVEERGALLSLPLEKLRALMVEADRLNLDRLQRFREAFGELTTAGKTVSVVLMKSGRIDFATPLPEDPLTREIEVARGVRRAYFQFYLSPPDASPRRYNGYVEFVFDQENQLWIPTWTDFSGQPLPLFDAEAFAPLRPYDILYDGVKFVVAQSQPLRRPELFTLLMPRWTLDGALFAPRERR